MWYDVIMDVIGWFQLSNKWMFDFFFFFGDWWQKYWVLSLTLFYNFGYFYNEMRFLFIIIFLMVKSFKIWGLNPRPWTAPVNSIQPLHIITKKKRKFVFGKGSLPLEFLEFGGCYPQNLLIVLFKKMVSSKLG